MTRAPGWLPDPTRRHELRYWDGDLWTADVANGGVASFDPHDVPVTPPPSDTTWPSSSPLQDAPPPGPDAASARARAPAPVPEAEPAPPEPPSRPPGRSLPSPARAGGIDPTARFPPRATTAAPNAPATSWASGELGRQRRSSGRLVLVLGALVLVLGSALGFVLVGDVGGDGDGPDDGADDGGAAAAASTTSGPRPSGGADQTTRTTTSPPATDAGDIMVAAVAEGIVEGSGGAIDQSEAECMGRALIDEIGIDRLEEVTEATADEAGANPLDLLTEAEQSGAMTRMRACVDQATLDSLAPGGE